MPRRARSNSAQGLQNDIERAATERYPDWPREEVALPTGNVLRQRALRWYDKFCRHRTPEGWAPGDPGRLAMLARSYTYWERECRLFAEHGGDDRKVARLQSTVGLLSRQLGMNVAPIDGRQAAAFAGSRAKAEQMLEGNDGDDLLARPGGFARPN